MNDLLYQLALGIFLLLFLVPTRSLLRQLMPRQQWPNYPIRSFGEGLAIAIGLGLLYSIFSLLTVLIELHLQIPPPAPPARNLVIAKFITCVAQPLVETLILLSLLLLPGSIFSALSERGKFWILRNRKGIYVGMAAVILGSAHPGYSLQVWKNYTPFAIFRTLEAGAVLRQWPSRWRGTSRAGASVALSWPSGSATASAIAPLNSS